jgi:transcriptional regulator with PAS, ATPase and Fis domain
MDVFELIDRVSKSSATVLITGESGTGKELVAQAIHNRSKRVDKLFVPVNCAAIPESLLESELFGYEKGAFTGAHDRHIGKFEVADRGTIFLDEIGTLPLFMQAKLLRILQEKVVERVGGTSRVPIDTRIIAATNINLLEAVQKKKFRKDLYYRLNVIPIELPPLRARVEDIPILAHHFISKFNIEFGKDVKGFTNDALSILSKYNWHGNIRELENLIGRLVVLSRNGYIGADRLPPEISKDNKDLIYDGLSLKEAAKSFEFAFIKKAIEKAGGSKSKTAKLLGIHRNTLSKIIKNRSKNRQ